jgi:hypothetical protein
MHPHRLKILCAYVDIDGPNWLEEAPEITLQGHELTIVHTYREAKEAILDSRRGIPSFDVILADAGLPGGYVGEADIPIYSPVILQPWMDQMLVRGLGIFVPRGREIMFEQSDGYSVLVATDECWTPLDTRDWQALLDRVIKASDESDQFNVRHPEAN